MYYVEVNQKQSLICLLFYTHKKTIKNHTHIYCLIILPKFTDNLFVATPGTFIFHNENDNKKYLL